MKKDKSPFRFRKGCFKEVKVQKYEDGHMDLVLPQENEEELRKKLPNVSVVTITKDRGMFAAIMLYNWVNIQYPREKLEWLILDDSVKDDYNLRDYLPQDDPYIRYVKLDKWVPVAEKRNMAVRMAKYDYIVHMDDDDYYFPDHVLAKIRVMLHYNCMGVHSMPIGIYDMMERTSCIFGTTGTGTLENNDVAEATLAYKKEYWVKNPFLSSNETGMGEGRSFINRNFDKWMNLNFFFNTVSITHTKNITGHNRRFVNEYKNTNIASFENVFPPDFMNILTNIRKILLENYKPPNLEDLKVFH
jgi:glycosyltransferase involved in cell wall biosynthesis